VDLESLRLDLAFDCSDMEILQKKPEILQKDLKFLLKN